MASRRKSQGKSKGTPEIIKYGDPDIVQEQASKKRTRRCYYCTGECIVEHEHDVTSCRCKRHDMYVSAEDADWRRRNPHPDLKNA